MASNQSSNSISLKNSAGPPQLSSPAPSQLNSSLSSEAQRRSGGSGSFGAGGTTRAVASPRNKQVSRNPTKQSRRPRLADEDALAESAAMKSTMSRKGQTSITHLMNFSLPPRPIYHNQYLSHSQRHLRRNPTWGLGSGYHAVDKARFVHANYRFIVDPCRDYTAQSIDADVYLDWNNVLQILVSPQSQPAGCPICLEDPVAPRMAKCGHIFCLSCLIRYMHSSDETEFVPEKRARWKKCPICWDSIYVSETRPIRWFLGQEGVVPREGEDIVLRLVLRAAGSTLALPKESYSIARNEDIPWHYAADVMDFARVMKGTEEYMLEEFDREIDELEELEKHDELMYGEDSEWTGRAIKAVKEGKDRVKGIGNGPRVSLKPESSSWKQLISADSDDVRATPAAGVTIEATTNEESIADFNMAGSDVVYDKNGIPNAHAGALSTSLAQMRQHQGAIHAHSDYYFYEALLHYYLSPLDIRILKTAFGDYCSFPSTILPRVEHVSTGHVVDDELRKRAKYLAHLPHGCEVKFLECDWTDTVSEEVLNKFKDDIERRRRKNSDKAAREEKERARAEKEEDDKRYAAARRRMPSSPIVERFQANDFQPLQPSESGSLDAGLESTSPAWTASRPNGAGYASLASPSTSPSTHRTVWGTTAIAPTSPLIAPAPVSVELLADDGWLQGWEKELLRDDNSLVAQVEAMSVMGESSRSGGANVVAKKKKGKKITLMSTNARRGA